MSVGIVNLFALHRDLTDLLALDKKWMWACKAAFFYFHPTSIMHQGHSVLDSVRCLPVNSIL